MLFSGDQMAVFNSMMDNVDPFMSFRGILLLILHCLKSTPTHRCPILLLTRNQCPKSNTANPAMTTPSSGGQKLDLKSHNQKVLSRVLNEMGATASILKTFRSNEEYIKDQWEFEMRSAIVQ